MHSFLFGFFHSACYFEIHSSCVCTDNSFFFIADIECLSIMDNYTTIYLSTHFLMDLWDDSRFGYYKYSCSEHSRTGLCTSSCFDFSWITPTSEIGGFCSRDMFNLSRNGQDISHVVVLFTSQQCSRVPVSPSMPLAKRTCYNWT